MKEACPLCGIDKFKKKNLLGHLHIYVKEENKMENAVEEYPRIKI